MPLSDHQPARSWERRLWAEAEAAAFDLDLLSGEHARLLFLLDRTATLRHVADLVRRATGADVSMVAPVEDGDSIVIRFVSGVRGRSLLEVTVPAGLGLGGRVLASLCPVSVDDYFTASSITHQFDAPVREEGLHALAAVPILTSRGVAGVIYAGLRRPDGHLGDRALDAMQTVSYHAGLALQVHDRAAATADAQVEDERHRLAIDLHDSVGAMLFGIGAQVRDLRTESCSPGMLERLSDLEQRVSDAAAALRMALSALSDVPEEHALAAAAQGDCRSFEERTGIAAKAIVLGDIPTLNRGRQLALHRVVREALLNVEKHARASSVVVSLAAVDDGVTVVVSDDGVGLGADGNLHPGLGLGSLRDGVAQVGGVLSVIANDDGGTTVRGWVPCL